MHLLGSRIKPSRSFTTAGVVFIVSSLVQLLHIMKIF